MTWAMDPCLYQSVLTSSINTVQKFGNGKIKRNLLKACILEKFFFLFLNFHRVCMDAMELADI